MDDLDLEIRKNRSVNMTVQFSHQGSPVAHQEILVKQKKHKFLFGSNWGECTLALVNGELSGREKELAELRTESFLQIFNQVTLPFYWARFEPQPGHLHTQQMFNAAQWYMDHGCVVKGHPLCWHTLAPDWLLSMSNHEILRAQLDRIQREVSDFIGLIDQWDVVNEAVIMPIFDRYDNGLTRLCKELGRIELIRMMFNTARSINPQATLLVNDFDISPAYDILIEGCLAAGIQIDAIGIQAHMHQGYWGVERTRSVLERFERFKLPIHFTENTIISGKLMPPHVIDLNDYQVSAWPSTPEGELRQAQQVVLHYKTLLAHPAVEAITWWDLSDGGWLNAPAGLLHRDHSRKPAYDELLKLIKGKWWLSPTRMMTDVDGRLSFTGFMGEYELSIGKQIYEFSVQEKDEALIHITI
jgi:endo-1,4-beta-xylanase